MTTPDYYKRSGHECRELSAFYFHPHASAIEYVWRHKGKGGVDDLRKALDWLEWEKTHVLRGSSDAIIDDLIHDTSGPEQQFWKAVLDLDWDAARTALRELIDEEEKNDREVVDE